jgi:6-phosphogluconolactonase
MTTEVVLVDEPGLFARTVSARLARALHGAIAARGWATIGLPAGTFQRSIYAELCIASLDWSRVEFFFVEERGVPASHPASAFAEAEYRLFDNPRVEDHQVHRIEGGEPDLARVAERYAEELPEAFDVLLLEPGADGHLGALYPDSPLFDDERDVLALELEHHKPRRRVMLAPRVIEAAREIVVAASGPALAEVTARVLEGDEPPRTLPAALLRGRTWIVDRAALARCARAGS